MRVAKILVPIVLTMFLLISAMGVFAQNEITVNYNGKPLEFDTPPYMKDDRVLVPLRKIMEAMDAEINWDSQNQIIQATRTSTDIYMKIGEKMAYVNYAEVTLDVPPEITNGKTFVPLRFVSESIGAEVNWNGQTQSISIKFDDTKYKLGERPVYGDTGFVLEKAGTDSNGGSFIAEGTMDKEITGLSLNVSDGLGYVIPMQTTITQQGNKLAFKAEAYLPNCHNFIAKYVEGKAIISEQKAIRIGEYVLD